MTDPARGAEAAPSPAELDTWLRRIGAGRPASPDAGALALLHEAHLLAVPFENLSIHWGEPVSLDPAACLGKIARGRRGGFCYELNGLFGWALGGLGYEVELLSARVRREGGGFGPEFDHVCLRVRAGGESWLADVGFGDSFRRPLPLAPDEERTEGRRAYALHPVDGELELVRRAGDGPWEPLYRLSPAPRRREEFAGMLSFHTTSPESSFTRRRVCTIATPGGRTTLSEAALVRTTLEGERVETPVADATAWAEALRTHFGIVAPAGARPPGTGGAR